jgi:hypothetical protein
MKFKIIMPLFHQLILHITCAMNYELLLMKISVCHYRGCIVHGFTCTYAISACLSCQFYSQSFVIIKFISDIGVVWGFLLQ